MFCLKCGNELPDGVLFCNKCGTKVGMSAEPVAPAEQPMQQQKEEFTQSSTPVSDENVKASSVYSGSAEQIHQKTDEIKDSVENISKKYKKIFIIVGGIVAFFIVLILIFGIVRSVSRKNDKSDKSDNDIEEEYFSEADEEYSEAYSEEETGEVKQKSDKASELEEVDLFEGVEVTFSGDAPNGSASVRTAGSNQYNLNYKLDKTNGLRNGDTVTVSVYSYYSEDIEDYLMEQYSVRPSSIEKTYKVEGLAKYVESLDEIPDELMNRMKKQAEDVFYGDVAKWTTEDGTYTYANNEIEDFRYIGEYLLTAKSGDSNMLTLVYKPAVTVDLIYHHGDHDSEWHKTEIYYWYVTYNNILIDQEGKVVVDIDHYKKCYNPINSGEYITSSGFGTYIYDGYAELDDVYRVIVSQNLEKYNHEDNINDISDDELLSSSGEESSDRLDEDYILPDSSTKYLKEKDLEGLSEQELKIARNEIYARHGRKFTDSELQEYFESKDWYEPSISADDFKDEDYLNKIELTNLDLIVEYEKK